MTSHKNVPLLKILITCTSSSVPWKEVNIPSVLQTPKDDNLDTLNGSILQSLIKLQNNQSGRHMISTERSGWKMINLSFALGTGEFLNEQKGIAPPRGPR